MLSSLSNNQLIEFKSNILKECKSLVEKKLNNLISSLKEVTESSNSESKSSAGDKHETSKAMMQIEQEKLSKQISELKIQKSELEKIIPNINREKIIRGSLIETNHGLFFISEAIGKINISNKVILAISTHSPIGKEMIDKNGKQFSFNHLNYEINFIA